MLLKRELSVKELREQAFKKGYILVKKKPFVKLDTCICGGNKRSHISRTGDLCYGLQCKKCGMEVWGKNERDSRIEWNKLISKLKDDKQIKWDI